MISEVLSFLAEVFSAGILAYVAMLATEPKKQRISDYNSLLNDFINLLNQTHNLAIQYWSCEGRMKDMEGHLLAAKTECNRLATTLNRKQCKLFAYSSVSQKLSSYFRIITGDTFQQETRLSDANKLDQACDILKDLKDIAESAKIPFTVKNIIRLKVA